jgi:hypothetical protein
MMRQTRDCDPSGCSSESRCTSNSACEASCNTGTFSPSELKLYTQETKPAVYLLYDSQISRGNCSDVDSLNLSYDSGELSVSPSSGGSCRAAGGQQAYTLPFDVTALMTELGTSTIRARVTLNGRAFTCGSLDVKVEFYRPWFQTLEADVAAGGRIESRIPNKCLTDAACKPFFSVGDQSSPGVVAYDGSGTSFGDGSVSDSGMLAKTRLPRNTYGYFAKILDVPAGDNFNDFTSLNPGTGLYYSDNNVTINQDWPAGQTSAIILVNGDLNINHNIVVPAGRFLAFIVRGKIEVNQTVSRVQGLFFADGPFEIHSRDGDEIPDPTQGAADTAFTGEGAFFAGSYLLGRELLIDNGTNPAEKFVFRPDFWFNAPEEIKTTRHTWVELVP